MIGFIAYCESTVPTYSRTGLSAALVMLSLDSAAWVAVGTFFALATRGETASLVATLLVIAPHGLLTIGCFPFSATSTYIASFGIEQLARGVANTRPVVLSASILWLFLFLSVRLLEARRWKP